jgi:hypothetical protein
MLKSFTIDDDLALSATGAVEVTVELRNGQRRWCFFMTPEALSQCGDWLPGTQTRVHFGAPHMIVVSQLDEQVVEKTLHMIDKQGELEACTRPFE